jgi:hypothetical protein
MKLKVIALFGLLAMFSCSEDEKIDSTKSCSKGSNTYSNDYGTTCTLNTQDWYLQRNELDGGDVGLKIAGSIIGDSLTLRTYGDGVILDSKIPLNSSKEFNEDFTISFTANGVPEGEFTSHTLIMVYNGLDTLDVELESCALKY